MYIKKMKTTILPQTTGSITDTLNVTDKVTNAPSVRLTNDILAAPVNSIIAYDGDIIPEGYEEVSMPSSSFKLLWQNPNRDTFTFPAQTISLNGNLKNFDLVLITFISYNENGYKYNDSTIGTVFNNISLHTTIIYSNNYMYNGVRNVTMNNSGTNTTLTFYDAHYYCNNQTSVATVGNGYCVPAYIYGIKIGGTV